jgi:hypothetical protein
MDPRPQVALLSLLHSRWRPSSSFLFFIHAGASQRCADLTGSRDSVIHVSSPSFYFLPFSTHNPRLGDTCLRLAYNMRYDFGDVLVARLCFDFEHVSATCFCSSDCHKHATRWITASLAGTRSWFHFFSSSPQPENHYQSLGMADQSLCDAPWLLAVSSAE